ncbi:Knirps-related protein [Dirofilaria immitis]
MIGNRTGNNNNNRFTATQVTFLCQVCNELARGYHFGAFTCEGCKSFFGRTCKPSKGTAIDGNNDNRMLNTKMKLFCKNGGKCNVQGRNRTSCKLCRFNKCIEVGMAPQNSRYGRRSKYFKVSSLLKAQERARFCDDYQSSNPVDSSSAQLIKPVVPAPVWTFPIWLSTNIFNNRDVLANLSLIQ